MTKKKDTDPIELLKAPFSIAKYAQLQRQREINKMIHTAPTKKELRKLRKEAKAAGFKVVGKTGPDGRFHIYLKKGGYERQWM